MKFSCWSFVSNAACLYTDNEHTVSVFLYVQFARQYLRDTSISMCRKYNVNPLVFFGISGLNLGILLLEG
jgi:hypothetical protein